MRTIFALYDTYDKAKQAVDQLLNKDIDKDNINVIVQKRAVEGVWDVNERTIDVQVTDELGRKKVKGLDAMLGRQQPVQTSTAGDIYASGQVATVLARTASMPGAVDGGLKNVFKDFGVSANPAEAYDKGIRGGQFLVFVRSDEDEASQVAQLLDETKARDVSTVTG